MNKTTGELRHRARRVFLLAVTFLTVAAWGTVPARGQAPACQFILGFATLRGLIGPPVVGDCLEDQRFAANGNAEQRTTGGLLVWRKADNWTAFTDGYRTWLNGPFGLQQRLNAERFEWEGPDAAPPAAEPAPAGPAAADALPWVRAASGRLVDAAGREVVLRGFVTVTHTADGAPAAYTAADYRRMRTLGANYQALRLGAGALGFAPNSTGSRTGAPAAEPGYVERVAAMVALAAQAGVYTSLKLTTYDVPALRAPADWEALWRGRDAPGGAQARLLAAWRPLWDRLKDDPAVLGFDLLNEPQRGSLAVADQEFVRQYLTPFYQQAIDELRGVDSRHLALFQPPLVSRSYRTPIGREQTVYAPHFYPNLLPYLRSGDFSTREYEPELRRFLAEADLHGTPLLIGEYGMPWPAARDGDAAAEARYRQLERAAVDLFDAHRLSATRPWFADDRAGTSVLTLDLNWALIKGRGGLGGAERTFITDVIARPFPQRVAGQTASFAYDPSTRVFTLRYTPAAQGETEIFIPRARQSPNGFSVTRNPGLALTYDAAQPSGLRRIDNPAGVPATAFRWDEAHQLLTVAEWTSDGPVALEVHLA